MTVEMTAKVPERDRSSPVPRRKRSVALVGMSSWLLLSSLAEASPLSQHSLRPAQRSVRYRRADSEQKPRIPSCHGACSDGTESGDAFDEPAYHLARRRNRMMLDGSSLSSKALTGDDEEGWSHLIVDAARESVNDVFRELRHRRTRRDDGGGTSSSPWWSFLPSRSSREGGRSRSRRRLERDSQSSSRDRESRPWPWRRLLRRTTERSAGVTFSASSNQSSSPGFVNVDLGSDQEEFNITAGTEYDGVAQGNSTVNSTNSSHAGNRTGGDATTVIYTDSQRINETNSTNGTGRNFRPIRIRAYLSEVEGAGQFLSDKQHSVLFLDVLRPAMLTFSAALRVDSVQGNLTVDRSQLIDGATCGPGRDSGLPSALVPESHMTAGVANADMIVYLNIGFAPPKRNTSSVSAADLVEGMVTRVNATGNDRAPISSQTWQQVTALRNASGAAVRPTCSGEYLAASAICSTDQYDRPTAAILHICIDEDFFNETSLRRNIITMRHELAHSLGFNSISLAHFRRPDGTPITPRRENGEIPLTEVECTGPLRSRNRANVTLPSAEILQFRNVRGGVRVAEVVTPSVAKVVRNHFDCQDLPGAELESGEFLPLSTGPQTPCLGDHWERRLFKNDLMNPVVEDLDINPRISTLDLAYFADSGWYQVDLSRAAPPSGWGRAAGCEFVDQPCVNADGQVPAKFQDSFCSDSPSLDEEGYASVIDGCTTDLTKKASCSIELYQGDLPTEYQYFNFTYGSNVGGRDPLMDYCPVYAGFTNGLCSDSENEALIRIDRIERFGDRNSRCIPGLLSARRTALCLRIACVVEDSSFHVQVDGAWKPCSYKNQVIETPVGDRVFCPDPIRVCPTFYCQRDCLGTDRICNYTQGKCVCAENCTDSEGPESFYDPPANSSSSLPDEDSPLSDYYVPTSRMLRDERRVHLEDWQVACVSLACGLLVCLIFYWLYRKRQASFELAAGNPNDLDGPAASVIMSDTDPNKDKMIASVVVDLRMNTPQLRDDALQDRASETDLSLTDTDGGGTHVTDLSIDFQAGGVGLDDSLDEYVDPLAAPSVVRRRNVHA